MAQTIKYKSFDFALRIIQLYKVLQKEKEYILSKQILRSATSVGALVRESEFAESRKDFIHKLHIALKEANETFYWLELLELSGFIEFQDFDKLKNENQQIIYMLIYIIKSSKKNLNLKK